MVLGAKHVEAPFIVLGQIATLIYFLNFLVVIPALSIFKKTNYYLLSTDSRYYK